MANQPIRNHRDLIAWQRAISLVNLVYEVTEALPPDEKFGLRIQARRAAVSVAANIAEGHGRDHLGDYLRHLSFANGSLAELDTIFEVIKRRRFLSEQAVDEVTSLADEVGRIVNGLVRALKRRYRPDT